MQYRPAPLQRLSAGFVLLSLVAGLAAPATPVRALPVNLKQSAQAAHGMVASASGYASQVGVDILKRGGNAVDAAVAVGLALAVTYPEAGNLGGGGFLLIRLANGKSTVIDYRETAPARATKTMYLDIQGKVIPSLSLVGRRAVGVPGTVAGLALAQKRYGKLPWRTVVEPARLLAARGFTVTPAMARNLKGSSGLTRFAESRRIFQRNGNYYKVGEKLRPPELAETLKRLQKYGPQEFYTGRTARLLARDMAANGGLITLADLKNYKPVERTPLQGTYRGYGVLTMPPPSSGGFALLEMLNILERHDLNKMGYQTAATDHLIVETMRRAFADRSEFGGDPDFVKVPARGLIAKAYATKQNASINPAQATPSSEIKHGQPLAYESMQTTHYSVVDKAGNAVSNTYTLNMAYGSGVTVPGAGFLLNNEMDDFASAPNTPNGFGLIQGEANSIAPRKRPLSSMTPTILTKDGKLFMVIGSPGGPTIINTVLQVITNVVDHRMPLAQAIAAPRLHHQWLPDQIRHEPGVVSAAVRAKMEAMGHTFTPDAPGKRPTWGDAEGILINARTGSKTGASDPRNPDARAIGY